MKEKDDYRPISMRCLIEALDVIKALGCEVLDKSSYIPFVSNRAVVVTFGEPEKANFAFAAAELIFNLKELLKFHDIPFDELMNKYNESLAPEVHTPILVIEEWLKTLSAKESK